MASIIAPAIAGTWSLISSSAEVVSKARGMTLGIHKLLQPEATGHLSEHERRRLIGLQRRVMCMVQPLNFLLLWSKSRDDRVQQVVLNAQELLFDIYTFIEDYSDDSSRRTLSTASKSEQLDFFLRELDFTCISVNMALNMETRNDPVETTDFSLLASLRAHRRIKEMEGRSGHLCAMLGCLYKGHMRSVEDAKWSCAMSLATFKVVAMQPGRCYSYGIEIESRLPLTQRDQRGSSTESPKSMAQSYGLNSSARLEFPITAACEAQLRTTGRLNLATSELAVDSLALVWRTTGDVEGPWFAFVFDGPKNALGDTGELVLTPLDAIYLARLCAERDPDLGCGKQLDLSNENLSFFK